MFYCDFLYDYLKEDMTKSSENLQYNDSWFMTILVPYFEQIWNAFQYVKNYLRDWPGEIVGICIGLKIFEI